MVHEGQFLEPAMRDLEKYLNATQDKVTGTVKVHLAPYRFHIIGIESKHDLMSDKFGSYGEMNKGWTADDAKGFIKITANAHTIYGSVNNTKTT